MTKDELNLEALEEIKFREGFNGEDVAYHLVFLNSDEAVCGQHIVKLGMSSTAAQLVKDTDLHDFGWHVCPECASQVTELPETFFEEYKDRY